MLVKKNCIQCFHKCGNNKMANGLVIKVKVHKKNMNNLLFIEHAYLSSYKRIKSRIIT
jgi:hypothetical protein